MDTTKQIKYLSKFIEKINESEYDGTYNALLYYWNKYKFYFNREIPIVNNLYENIENIIQNKNVNQNYEIRSDMLFLENDKKYIFRNIDRFINYYLSKKYMNDEDITIIISNLKNIQNISNKTNIDIFKHKLYELVFNLNNDEITDIYNHIKFSGDNNNIIIGDFFNKKYRTCSLLKKHECNEECYWSDTFWDKLKLWSSKCKQKDIKELLYNSYCSKDSYKTREELIFLIKSLTDDSTDTNISNFKNLLKNYIIHDEKKYYLDNANSELLCDIFKDILSKKVFTHTKTFEDQIYFLKRYNVNKYLLYESFAVIEDSKNNKNTTFETIKRLISYFTERKLLSISIITSIAMIISLYLANEYLIGENGIFNKKANFVDYELNTSILIDDRIPRDEFISYCKEKNVEPSRININNDKVITLEEYTDFKKYLEFFSNFENMKESEKRQFTNFFAIKDEDNFNENTPKIDYTEFPFLSKFSKKELLERKGELKTQYDTYKKNGDVKMTAIIGKEIEIINRLYPDRHSEENYSIINADLENITENDDTFNPFDNFVKKNDFEMEKNVTMKISNLRSLINVNYNDKHMHGKMGKYMAIFFSSLSNNILNWYHGDDDTVLSPTITCFARMEGDQEICEVVDGIEAYYAAYFLGKDITMNVNVLRSENFTSGLDVLKAMLNSEGAMYHRDVTGSTW